MNAAAHDDPIDAFLEAFARAEASEPGDHKAVTLATATADGRPSARVVLLHGADARGFVFYTNLGSRKATELYQNPRAALCCWWPTLLEQVRIEGPVAPLDAAESDAYFAARPRESQIGAWASRQSELLDSRMTLEARYQERCERFAGGPVPRPPIWGGFRLVPRAIEFWKHREHRLHDRLRFRREGQAWIREWLYP